MEKQEPLAGQIANLDYLEQLYRDFQTHPADFDPSWPRFFKSVEEAKEEQAAPLIAPTGDERIHHLVEAYRRYGHLNANINPLSTVPPQEPPELNLQQLGFQTAEEGDLFPTFGVLAQDEATLKEIVQQLKFWYSDTIGFEFKDYTDHQVEKWIQEQIESGRLAQPLSHEEKQEVLTLLTRAEILETFLHTKHVGKKRFSLEGAESLIPMLSFLIAECAEEGVKEIYIGMSHRGRLNVLANIIDKPIPLILKDFDDDYQPSPEEGMGDIRYHKGHANEYVQTRGGKTITLCMAPNPSHLESVDPVIEGQVHARQFQIGDEAERRGIIPLLLHGDAALAGQGVVYETLQMNKLAGFETGGTLHIAINNQIGFTTSPKEGRSTLYCTDIAHAFGMPVMHINAEDPERCVRAMLFALEIRQRFHCDVMLDLNCYRKYGHNEGDEPAFTQPLDYQIIRQKPSIRTLYLKKLMAEGVVDQAGADRTEESLKQRLQAAYDAIQAEPKGEKKSASEKEMSPIPKVETKVKMSLLGEVAKKMSEVPENFHLHKKLDHLVKERAKAVMENKPFDWGTAEYMAYGTLCLEGTPIRLAGQDSCRGTFSHRHALWVDQKDSHPYFPLAHLSDKQGRFEVLNTCLSEVAAMGFEYGYSTICTEGLTIWEAQFGDFANSAQVIIDQYIASGEQKWGQTSGLVLFLPHGFEGQGPEHSSARFERFLALAGHDNMQIVYPTLPAQLFHLLRRQVKQSHKTPLIVMTPKGLLRHPSSVSLASDLTEGSFLPILDDPRQVWQAKRLVICTGRVFFDLDERRQKDGRQDVAIVRLEQLYPLDREMLKATLARYSAIKDCLWVQEEPQNMGAWAYISPYLPGALPSNVPLRYVGREYSASPATGFSTRHKQEHAQILHQVFAT